MKPFLEANQTYNTFVIYICLRPLSCFNNASERIFFTVFQDHSLINIVTLLSIECNIRMKWSPVEKNNRIKRWRNRDSSGHLTWPVMNTLWWMSSVVQLPSRSRCDSPQTGFVGAIMGDMRETWVFTGKKWGFSICILKTGGFLSGTARWWH